MESRWRNFSLVFAVAAAVVTPTFAQVAAPTLGPADSGEEAAPSIPDYRGSGCIRFPDSSRCQRVPRRLSIGRGANGTKRYPQADRRLHQSDLEA
jgi:hypothetical protein